MNVYIINRCNIVKKLENYLYFFLSSFPLPSPSLSKFVSLLAKKTGNTLQLIF